MAEFRLFKKILKALKNERRVESVDEIEFLKEYNFYIPSTEVLTKVKSRQPLTQQEAVEYIKYIINNFYVDLLDVDKLYDFACEFSRFGLDAERYNMRRTEAKENLLECLSNGNSINILDALWFSDFIYVDGANSNMSRIIYKQITSTGSVDLQVVTQRNNPKVGYAVRELKIKLFEKLLNKPLDNNP